MNNIKSWFRDTYVLKVMFKRLLMRVFSYKIHRLSDLYSMITAKKHLIDSIINVSNLVTDEYNKELLWVSDMYIKHRFDILGSGWVWVGYGLKPLGIESHIDENQSRIIIDSRLAWIDQLLSKKDAIKAKIIYNCISQSYEPIDWHIDFKSGYRWSAKEIANLKHSNIDNGVDVKICWDLGRMQHLIQLSLCAKISKEKRSTYIVEYKNQVLDFIALNPLGKGVQWSCCMDVAIRASNLLVSYDIIKQFDEEKILNSEFSEIFSKSIYNHGQYIMGNLELNLRNGVNQNHYLSNLIGLLYISVYLKLKGKTKNWYNFAKKEFFREIQRQFFSDGTNFEGSTSYHRLSTELVVFGLAVINRIETNIPEDSLELLVRAGDFSQDIRKSNGEIVQIGDNDSGRLFKFTPQGVFVTTRDAVRENLNLSCYLKRFRERIIFDENFINHDSLLSAITGLVDYPLFHNEKSKYPLESSVVKEISGKMQYKGVTKKKLYQIPDNVNMSSCSKGNFRSITTIRSNFISISNEEWKIYENFGLYIYKSDRFELFFNIGRPINFGLNGHTHNDVLHVELCINSKNVIVDPGTYNYTALPEMRDYFRSYKAHFVPDYGIEPNKFFSTFSLDNEARCRVINISSKNVSVVAFFQDIVHYRTIEILEGEIRIYDYSNKNFLINTKPSKYFSAGYGKISYLKTETLNVNVDYFS